MTTNDDKARKAASDWASSDTAMDLANVYESTAKTLLGQQRIFQAHLDGQNTGFKNGYITGVAWARANEWVACSERMPEEPGKYLVCFSSGSWHAYYFMKERGFYHPSHSSDMPVTHWMPVVTALPPAPEGE